MKLAYYPGCSAQSTCKELNVSTQLVARKLGLELQEYRSTTCTGSREIRAVQPELFLALNARILAMAERDQGDDQSPDQAVHREQQQDFHGLKPPR